MFWEKKCQRCRTKIKSEWIFCPNCGLTLKETRSGDMFQEIEKEFNQLDRMMERAPKFIMKPPLKAKGVSITITSDNMTPPKINVQTFGNRKHHHHHVHEIPAKIPKTTEEPTTKIQKVQNRQVITLDMPDVKSLEDIEIKQLNQSIEIKAFAGDKAYFKLIPIPTNASVNNEFKDGVLKIEVVK